MHQHDADGAHGATRAITGTATLNIRAPGQYFLAESGTMSNWHRQYDPTLGRYLQPDPVADVLATRPVNLDGSTLVARGGISGGSQLASPTAAAASTRHRSGVGNELPTFVDGPSLYAYARSQPSMMVDLEGTQVSPAMQIASYCWRFPALCTATAAAGLNACYRTMIGFGGRGGC